MAALLAAGVVAGPPRLTPRGDQEIAIPYGPATPLLPVGRWLWVGTPRGFGFANAVHVVHWNDFGPLPIELRWNGQPIEPAGGVGRASRMEMEGAGGGLEVHESKLLTGQDVLVSVLRFRASAAGRLEVSADAAARGEADYNGLKLWAEAGLAVPPGAAGGPGTGARSWQAKLAAGQRAELRVAVAFGASQSAARAALARTLADPDPVAAEAARTTAWLQAAPGFDAPDPAFSRAFLYRLLVARKSLSNPGAGRLRQWFAAEGRFGSRWYPAAITFGAGHQLAELRWLGDPSYAWGHLQCFLDNQRRDGAFVGARIGESGNEYTDFIAAGAYDLYLVTGDRARFAAAGPALACNVDYVAGRDRDQDGLPEPDSHWQTGMEWQPSFFALDDYDTTRESRLDRVDYACYHYANAQAAARALELGGNDGSRYRAIASRTAGAIESLLWDRGHNFYLSLRSGDHAQPPDREVIGFYPPGFGLTPLANLGYLQAIADPLRWAAPYPLPSVEMESPAFWTHNRWPIGPGGSATMWNGPTWPHAQSFVALSLGRAERAGALPAGTTFGFLSRYTQAHFFGVDERRDLSRPVVGEMYDPIHGVWLTTEREYFHSRYVDLVIRLLAGLEPAEGDRLDLSPLVPAGKWDHFALVRVPYHGHQVALAWDAPGGDDAYGDGLDGLVVWVDGQVAGRRPDLGPLRVNLPGGRR